MNIKLNYLLFFFCFYLLKLSLFTGFEFLYLYILCLILRDSMGRSILILNPYIKVLIWMLPFYLFPLSLMFSLPILFAFIAFLLFAFAFYYFGFTGFFILQGYGFNDSIKKARAFKALSLDYKFLFSIFIYLLVYSFAPAFLFDILISLFVTQWFFSSMKDLNLVSVDKAGQ